MSQEIQKVKKSRLFWIGLLSSILIYINWNPLIPLWILIVLILILLKKNFQEQFKANLKKFLIIILIWFILWISWMWLQIQLNYSEAKAWIKFNLNLLPSNLIWLFFDWSDYSNTIFSNNQFSWDTEECKRLSNVFVKSYNDKDFEGIREIMYSKISTWDREQIKRQFVSSRELWWSIAKVDYKWYLRSKNIQNDDKYLQHLLYFKSDVEFLWTWKDLEFKCIYNYDKNTREMLGFNVPPEPWNYKISTDEIPFWNMMQK